jgi:hypothetical protein
MLLWCGHLWQLAWRQQGVTGKDGDHRRMLDGGYPARFGIVRLSLMSPFGFDEILFFRGISCLHYSRAVRHPLQFHLGGWNGWHTCGHPLFRCGRGRRDQGIKVSLEDFEKGFPFWDSVGLFLLLMCQ